MDDKKHAELCARLDKIVAALEALNKTTAKVAGALQSIKESRLTAWVWEG